MSAPRETRGCAAPSSAEPSSLPLAPSPSSYLSEKGRQKARISTYLEKAPGYTAIARQ